MTLTKKLALRLGRRGVILTIVGVIWLVYGQGILGDPPPPERFSKIGPSPLDWMDSALWGWLWIFGGVVALAIGLGRRAAPDPLGFAAAILPAIPWSVFYWYSFLVHAATAGEYGEPGTWRGGIMFLLIIIFIRTCAGWDDPTDPFPKKGKGDERIA